MGGGAPAHEPAVTFGGLPRRRLAIPWLHQSALVESAPLYAGESIERVDSVRPAGELVRGSRPAEGTGARYRRCRTARPG
jgi:hypothetical protein